MATFIITLQILLSMPKTKVAIFGSFYRGYYVIKEILKEDNLQIVGIATDNPSESYVSPSKRVWQYPHTIEEENLTKNLAKTHNIPLYNKQVKTEEFYNIYENKWKPDICIMATFGQLINEKLFKYPKYGFYNLHPCSNEPWPNYPGPNPFNELIKDKKTEAVIAMHKVNKKFDDGELIELSEPFQIPKAATVIEMHKISSPIAAKLALKNIKIITKSHSNLFKTKP